MDKLVEFTEFIVFSMIESFAITAVMLSIFRFKIADYLWAALLINLIMSLQSFVLREELSAAAIVPIINIVLLTFFAMIVVRVPMLWAVIMSFFGSVIVILMQVLIVAVSGQPVSWFQAEADRGYFLQTTTGVVMIATAYALYKFGIGFSFHFDNLRFKWERVIIYSLIGVMMIAFGVLASQREVYIDILFLLLALIFFTYYTFRKETEDD
jgi:hypothetical protein